MAELQRLKRDLKEQLRIIEDARAKIDEIALDVNRLMQPDVLPVNTIVKLKRDWNTDQDREKRPGWRGFLHFMNPTNFATIKEVSVYKQKISYLLSFQDQWSTDVGHDGKHYRLDGLFHFRRDEFEVIFRGDIKDNL